MNAVQAPAALTIRLEGELLQDAQAASERGTGRAVLTVLLQQQHDALPVVATLAHEDTPANHLVLHATARRLRKATTVKVSGRGIVLTNYQGHQALRVIGVNTIEPPMEPTTRKDLA